MSSEDSETTTVQEISMVRAGLKTPRAAAIAGIAFSVLFIAIMVLFRISVPANPLEAGTWLAGRWKFVDIALQLMPVAGIAFLWFIAVMRDRIGAHEDRFFSTVFFGSGLLFVAMLFSFSAVAGAIIMIYRDTPDTLTESVLYSFGRAMTYQFMNAYGIKMAGVFMILTSTLSLRTGIIPRWMALSGYPLALSLFLCASYFQWFPLIFPLWVLMISMYVLITNLARTGE
jgi:hypothetical protein